MVPEDWGTLSGIYLTPKKWSFLHLNANKLGITLNPESDTGKKTFKELAKRVDILVENFNSRVLPDLGLNYEVLEQLTCL